MFHRFRRDGMGGGPGAVSASELDAMIRFVGRDRILNCDEWLDRLKSGALRDSDLCLTFDDGLKSQMEIAFPVLEQHGIKAFWFVFSSVFEGKIDRNEAYHQFAALHFASFELFAAAFLQFVSIADKDFAANGYDSYFQDRKTSFPFYTDADIRFRFVRDRVLQPRSRFEDAMDAFIQSRGFQVADIAEHLWMTNQDLIQLSRANHCVGLHSYDHPFVFAALDEEEQRQQYRKNQRHIQEVTGTKAIAMSHPLNSYGNNTLAILSELGIECGFRSNMQPPSDKPVNSHPLELAREDSTTILKQLT